MLPGGRSRDAGDEGDGVMFFGFLFGFFFPTNSICPFQLQLPSQSRRHSLMQMRRGIPREWNSLHRQARKGSAGGDSKRKLLRGLCPCRLDGQPLPAAEGELAGTGHLTVARGKNTGHGRGMCRLRNGWVGCTCFLLQTSVHGLDRD